VFFHQVDECFVLIGCIHFTYIVKGFASLRLRTAFKRVINYSSLDFVLSFSLFDSFLAHLLNQNVDVFRHLLEVVSQLFVFCSEEFLLFIRIWQSIQHLGSRLHFFNFHFCIIKCQFNEFEWIWCFLAITLWSCCRRLFANHGF
jgi:hypothetical protein